MILKQLFNLNYFIVYIVLAVMIAIPVLGPMGSWGFLVPLLVAFLLVYIFKLVPYRPRENRKLWFYAGQVLIMLANGLVILSIALPVLWSSVADDENLLMLLWLAIPALVVAVPGWIIGMIFGWVFGTRQPPETI